MTNKSSLELDGRQMGADCLRELRMAWVNVDLSNVPDQQIGEVMLDQEPEVLRRYLHATRNAGPACERGFLCVLSEFMGSNAQDFDDVYVERRYER